MTTILITVDSLRYDFVFGDRRDFELPTLDRLAEQGVVFDRAYANAPYTADSFTAILGGTHPWTYGTATEGFEAERPHIVEPFAATTGDTLGVYTNPFLGPAFDYDRGYDTYVEGTSGRDGVLNRLRQFVVETIPPESRVYKAIRWSHRTVTSTLGTELEGKPYPDAQAVNKTFQEWLRDASDPQFAWLHYMDVHSPFYPHEGTRSGDIDEREALKTFYAANKRPEAVSPEEVELLETLYIGELQYLDRQLASLLDHIDEELGHEQPTILFTSDHGEAFNEHGFCFHPKELYEELVRIPFIVRGPGFESGRVKTPVSTIDIFPTLVAEAGLEIPEAVEGHPIQELPEERDDPRYVYAQAIDDETTKAMVTDGQHKLIAELNTDEREAYDLIADPAETDPLPQSASPVERLEMALADNLASMNIDTDHAQPDRDVPDAVSEQLEHLGYK